MGCGVSSAKALLHFDEVSAVKAPILGQQLLARVECTGPGSDGDETELDFDEASYGVRASVLKTLMEECGRGAMAKMTTATFSETVIKPKTAGAKNSYTQQLFHTGPAQREMVGRAVLSVAHTWKGNVMSLFDGVLDFVEQNKDELGEDPIVWLDLLSVSQHDPENSQNFDRAWWMNEVFEAIGRMKRVVVILETSHALQLLTRLWIVFELLACVEKKGKISLCVPPAEKERFMQAVQYDPTFFLQQAKDLDVSKCSCYSNADKDAICEDMFKREYTFPDVENLLAAAIEKAWVDLVGAQTEAAKNDVAKGEAKKAFGQLLVKVGRANEAVKVLQSAVTMLKAAEGEDGSATLAAMSTLGVVYAKEGRHEEMKEVCEQVLEARTKSSGAHDSIALAARSNLARAYSDLKQHDKALAEHKEVLSACRDALGEDHEQTLASMISTGASQYQCGDLSGAEATLSECLAKRRALLGEQHQAVGLTMSWLGSVYMSLRRYEEAYEMKKGCFDVYHHVLGAGHPDTIQAQQNLHVAQQRLQSMARLLPSAA